MFTKMNFLVCLQILTNLHLICCGSVVEDITSSLFQDIGNDIVAAFGDFDADKLTDIFVISDEGKKVDILLADVKGKNFKRQNLLSLNGTSLEVTSVVPGDFNGDLQMDVLITTKQDDDSVDVTVYWSTQTDKSISISGPTHVASKLQDQPLVLDWNADMIPDFLAQEDDLYVWLAEKEHKNFTKQLVSNTAKLQAPRSHAFIDLNNDYSADLFLTTKTQFEEWYNTQGSISFNNSVAFPTNTDSKPYAYMGDISFGDFDQDSVADVVMPVCVDSSCDKGRILIYRKGAWEILVESITKDKEDWGFVKPEDSVGQGLKATFPMTLRVGDFNMDGYPDILAILKHKVGGSGQQGAFLLLNAPCPDSAVYCKSSGRTLSVQWDTQFSQVTGVVLAAFYDVYEDGILDVILVAKTGDTFQLKVYKNVFSGDACFIKITVVSGLCSKNCPGNRKPFGANQPGPTVKYDSVTPLGKPQRSCGTQLSQSSHFSLQLPFIIFGLGQTPNFVDNIRVGIPPSASSTSPHSREWTQIIPNSQLAVIPYPTEKPSSWKLHLYVTPSRNIYITGAALVGTCGFIAGIVGILQLRERREDKLEKQQEAQKFHFDAM